MYLRMNSFLSILERPSLQRISFWIRVPFICCRFIRNRQQFRKHRYIRIYIYKRVIEREKPGRIGNSFLPSPSSPFSKWPPERKQMAWRISRSTGNYQTEGIPWVIKRTLPFPAEKRPFVPPYVYTLSWNRPSTDLSAKRIGLASFGKPDRAWLYSALILTFVRIPSIEEHRLRFLPENSSSLSGRYEGNLSSRGNLDFFLFIRFNLFSSSSSSSREKRKFENICEFVSNKF